MEVIESSCPQCSKRLRIDAGFVGGICRCKYCGTLLSVSRKGGKVRLKPADQTAVGHTMQPQKRDDAPPSARATGSRRTGPASSDDSLPPGSPVIVLPEGNRPTGPVPTVSASGSTWRRPDRPPGSKPAIPPAPPPGFIERHRVVLLAAGVLALAGLVAAAAWAVFRALSASA